MTIPSKKLIDFLLTRDEAIGALNALIACASKYKSILSNPAISISTWDEQNRQLEAQVEEARQRIETLKTFSVYSDDIEVLIAEEELSGDGTWNT